MEARIKTTGEEVKQIENTNTKRGNCARCPHSSFGRYAFFCNYYKLEVGQFEPTCNNPDLMK